MAITPPDRATCCESGATIHGAEHIHRDPAVGRRSNNEPLDEPLWICGECLEYLTDSQ